MPNLKETRNRIVSVTSTQQITRAMKMVAAAKLKRAQDSIMQMRPYAQSLDAILSSLSANYTGEVSSPFLNEKDQTKKVLLIVLTSDRGLCGAFNNALLKKTVIFIEENYKEHHENGMLELICLGKRGYEFFNKRGYKVTKNDYTNIFTRLSFDNVKEIAEYIMGCYEEETYDKVHLVYNEFKNVATQIHRNIQYLPVEKPIKEEEKNTQVDYMLEPSPKEIIEEMIPTSLKISLYKACLESNASEQGARMSAMDKATENAGDLIKELKLSYNRGRQAAITKEILEIVGGAEALA